MTAADLTAAWIGRTIAVGSGPDPLVGVLCDVRRITEWQLDGNPTVRAVDVRINGHWCDISPDTVITDQEVPF